MPDSDRTVVALLIFAHCGSSAHIEEARGRGASPSIQERPVERQRFSQRKKASALLSRSMVANSLVPKSVTVTPPAETL